MFPSTGYFKSLHCPFHLEGVCRRIYCHFRHIKNASEKSGENSIILNLEKQICNDFGIDKEIFDILVNEEDENVHEKLLNRRLKIMFPDSEKLIDDFRFPESSKDCFEFSLTNKTAHESVTDLVNLTEQDDILLDEGPLKQFLEEDAKRNSNSEQTTHNTLEKRHMIISCLEKIDKKEFNPRRVGVVTPRKYSNANEVNNAENENLSINNNEENDLSVYNNYHIKIKQEIEASDSSESDDNAEVDSILTQMELLNPQLFSSGKNKELKRELVDESELKLNLTSKEILPSLQNTMSYDTLDSNAYQSLGHPLPPLCSDIRYGRINPKSVQAINSEVVSIAPSSLFVKHENSRQIECPDPVSNAGSHLLAAATIAEQNRLKNVFKNTICTNIDQFFDLCDACKVYGTEIFNLLEPLLNYLIEKLNPEFNYEKLRQLHSQNISLACGLPFVSSCDHTKNCVECHNLLLSALSRAKVKKVDKTTETVFPKFKKSHHDTPLRQIEAGLHDITKEIISLGIPMEDNEIMANDEQMTQRVVDVKHVQCQTESQSHSHSHSHSKRESSRNYRHISKRPSSRENHKHKSKEAKMSSTESKKSSRSESQRTSSEKRSKHSHSELRSSKLSHRSYEKKRKENSDSDEDSSEEERDKISKRRRSSSTRDQESKKRLSSEKHTSESKRHKSENFSSSSRSKSNHHNENKTPPIETVLIEDSPEREEKAEKSDNSDMNNDSNPFGSDLSESSSDEEAVKSMDKNRTDSDNAQEEKQNSRSSKDFLNLVPTAASKKRLSHVTETNSSLVRRKEIIVKKNIPTPSEVLFQRMQQSRKVEQNPGDSSSNVPSNPSDRVRISHVPNVALLLKEKEQLKNTLYQKTKPVAPPVRTIAQTTSKGQSRIAYAPVETPKPKDVPLAANNTRPTINSYKGTNNIPLPTRQNGLDRLYNALAKKVPAELASDLALKEERTIHEKVTITKVYLNSLAMAIHRIIKEDSAKLVEKNTEFPTELNGFSTYDLLSKHILTFEQMEINGFPLEIPGQPGCCMISTKAVHYTPLTSKRSGDRFYCLQCKDLFEMDSETGMPVTPSPGCRFHQLRPRKERGRTRHDVFYPCCNKSISESGCVTSEHHTPDTTDDDCLEGFLETREASPGEHGLKMFYALDCEMCYTTVGHELTRVTVIGPECNTVYDSLVKPRNIILDYCTKFSGITEDKLRNVTKNLEQVRQELFKFIFKDTILIGHSLENDLKALKILHYKIVDTSVMYPHRDAPERKFALKYLSSNFVQFLIQENEHGHDSKEDALACMKLVWKKIKEDSQLYRPRKIIGSPEKSK